MEPESEAASDADAQGLVEVEFDVDDSSYPFVGASDHESCQLELVEMVRRDDGSYSEYFRVENADPEHIREHAHEADQVEPYMLREDDDGGLFEFVVEGGCVAVSLAEMGGIPRVVRGDDGNGTLKAELPRGNAEAIVEEFVERHDGVELVARDVDADEPPVFSDPAFRETLDEELTMPQREAMLGAFSHGYYDWPQRTTSQEVARKLGVSKSWFAERLHAAERKVVSLLLERQSFDDERQQPLTDADFRVEGTE